VSKRDGSYIGGDAFRFKWSTLPVPGLE